MGYTYYLKKCCNQELGSAESHGGRPQRGRYLLTSMDDRVLSFFPALSRTQLNDSALLPIIPLYSGKKVYCNYVYHNDRYHNSLARNPRNEYRIYLNKSLEDNKLLFCRDDIVVFRREIILDALSDDEQPNDEQSQAIYLMDLVSDHTSQYYHKLESIIASSGIRERYGMYTGELQEFESKVAVILQDYKSSTVIDTSVTDRISRNSPSEIAGLFNGATFRDFVMTGYNNLCAISGTAIKYQDFSNLEAAHIKPRSHGGLYLPNNGLALCRDLHWAFDKGFFTLTDDLYVQVHPRIESDYLQSFNNQKIRVPTNPFFVPDVGNIRYHRENVYGLFLTSGRL